MNTQTSIVAKQVRLQQWAEQIKDCQSRPKDMDVNTWCSLHGITRANYYYRFKRVREACLEQIKKQSPEFVELAPPPSANVIQPDCKTVPLETTPVAILRGPNKVSIDLLPTATEEFLSALMGAFNHVE